MTAQSQALYSLDGADAFGGLGWSVIRLSGADLAPDKIEDLIRLALSSDRRASGEDQIPDNLPVVLGPSSRRRGYWANAEFGSRLWLLSRTALTRETIRDAEIYATEALEFLVADGLAASVNVTVERLMYGRIGMSIAVAAPDGSTVAVRFPDIWSV